MNASRVLSGSAVLVTLLGANLLVTSCLHDRIVAPEEPLPAVLAVDRPTVQLFRFALGRGVAADTVRITNNGEGELGPVQQVGGVDYVQGRSGWLRTEVVNLDENRALLVLEPFYAEDEQAQADLAEVVLKGAGAAELRTVSVVARTLRGASFEFSVNPVTFAAAPGEPPSNQLLTVRNGGNGTLVIHPPTIQYEGAAAGWLSVARVGGSETAPTFQVQADPEDLPGGLYKAYLRFESLAEEETRAKPASLQVQMNVGTPLLGVSTSALAFTVVRGGAAPPTQTIRFSNVGAGSFGALGALEVGEVTYGSKATGWLEASLRESGAEVAADPSGLPAGDYTASLSLRSGKGGARTVQVTLAVEAPVLTLSTRTLSFGLVQGEGDLPSPQLVRITNTGSGVLSSLGAMGLGSFAPEVAWVTAQLDGDQVSVAPTGSARELPVGTHVTRLPVESPFGGADTLAVTLAVSPGTDDPVLTLSATSVSFTGIRGDPAPPAQVLRVSNAGGGSLGAVTLGPLAYDGMGGWLSASLADTTLRLSVATGSLPAGAHAATVPVKSASGGSASARVVFTVTSPILTASATSASFSGVAGGPAGGNQSITLSNTGPGTFSSLGAITTGPVSYTGGSGWLSVSLSGTTLNLTLASMPASAGTYGATLPVTSEQGGSISIAVRLTVIPSPDAPDLVASPTSVRMDAVEGGPNPAAQTVALSNAGGGSLGTLGVVEVSPWLTASIAGSVVTLSAATGALASGTYTTQVTLTSSGGGDATVSVTLVVGAPRLTLSSHSASFKAVQGGSSSPPLATVTLSNTGAGGFSSLGGVTLGPVAYGDAGGWLTASLPAGSNTLSLGSTAGGLTTGTYTATVPVNSGNGGSESVAVALTVAPQPATPDLVLSSSAVGFAADEGGSDPDDQFVLVSNGGGGGFPELGTVTLGDVSYGPGASGWLSPSLGGDEITLAVTTGALVAGSYSAAFTVAGTQGGSASVSVAFDVAAAADPTTLRLGASHVDFVAISGGADPVPRIIPVFNAGSGSLGNIDLSSITYGAGAAGWLDGSSNSNADVTLVAETGSLSPGSYTATIEVTSQNGGSGSLGVTFRLGQARLTLDSRSLSFSAPQGGGSPAAQVVTLSNSGAGSFDDLGTVTLGSVSYGPGADGWLARTLSGDELSVRPATGTLAPGTYTATVPVSSPAGGSESASVTFTVAPSVADPALALSASSVSFIAVIGGSSPAAKVITLSNRGGGTFDDLGVLDTGFIDYGGGPSGWLGGPELVGSALTLAPSTSGLNAGTHMATVEVTSQYGGTQSVEVTVEVLEPALTASTLGLSFTGLPGGAAPSAQSVTLSNTGAGTFDDLGSVTVASVSYGAGASGWLTAPLSGTAIAGTTVAFRPSLSGLSPGSYSATVMLASENGGSRTIEVTLSVVRETDPPRLVLSATTQRFGALVGGEDPEPQSVRVSNGGGGELGTIQAGAPSYGPGATDWLTAAAAASTVTVRASTGSLAKGTYTASLPISSAQGGSESLTVTFVVGSPRLTVTPRTVSFGDTVAGVGPGPATVTLANTGGGTFSSLGSISLHPVAYGEGASNWLASALNGSVLTLTAETGNLGARGAPYEARFSLASEYGGEDTVTVAFTVASGATPPRLALSVDSVTFAAILGGGDPSPQTVTGSNAGGGSLGALSIGSISYDGTGQDWLSGSVSGALAMLDPQTAGLASGTHRATVIVKSENGGEATLQATLDLAQPVLSLSSRAVTFSDTVGSADTLRSQVFVSNTGGGTRSALGTLTLGPVTYPIGGTDWLETVPEPGATVEGFALALEGLAADLGEGTSVALVPVESEWGGSDTVSVTFAARRPDRSFDLPTIEFVRQNVVDGATVVEPLPGDSVLVASDQGDPGQIGVRVGVRNAAETRLTLSGLRVSTPSYTAGQAEGWITGAFLDRTSATFSEPAELFVAVAPGALAPGRYEAELLVSSEAVGLEQVSPRTLTLVLVVQ